LPTARRPFWADEEHADFSSGRARIDEMLRRTQARIAEYDELIQKRLAAKNGVKSANELPKDLVTKALRKKDLLTGEEFERLKINNNRKELYRRSVKRYDPLAYCVSDGPFDEKERARWSPPETFILPTGNLQAPGEKVTPGLIRAVYTYNPKFAT